MTGLDGRNRSVLVVESPKDEGEIVAVVRYDRMPNSKQAEYAALVEDRWQGCDLGLEMTRRLLDTARERGTGVLKTLVMPDNKHMLELLRKLGLPEHTHREDEI